MRRWAAVGLWMGCLVLVLAGCGRGRATGEGPLRLGFFPNITHGQALVGSAEGHFTRELGSGGVELKQFTAGPPAMEAVLGGSLDACYVGSGPALLAFVRSGGVVRVVAGAASGGAVLVTRGPERPEDFHGARVAVPQIGNTQDIALRTWLREHGLRSRDRGGDVEVLPLTNADTLQLFDRGQLDAAWVPEPWGARLVHEAGGRVLVDERTLWPGGAFPSTVLLVTEQALRERPAQVEALLRAHVALTREAQADPEGFSRRVAAAFAQLTGKPLREDVRRDAFSRLSFTLDPLPDALATQADDAHALGYLPAADVSGLVDTRLLQGLLSDAERARLSRAPGPP